MAKKQFKAESKRLLDLMINSIYTHREIFLRELISNASDAIDKRYYKALSEGDTGVSRDSFYIFLETDAEARTLKITDNGVGMTKEEMEKNLGTIARSGSLDFKSAMENAEDKDIDIIGQFGVGFYSAFMVSDKVTVVSRAEGSEESWIWESSGADGYTMKEGAKEETGTEVILVLKEDTEDENYSRFLEEYTIRGLIRKYSDYIRYPIRMMVSRSRVKEGTESDGKPEYETYMEEETLNSMVPLWKKQKSTLKDEDYNQFYHEKYFDMADPAKVIHTNVEGVVSYTALLFIPGQAPFDYYSKDFEKGLSLYSSGVLIMDKCPDLLPDHFSFVRGLVDSQDLSLNISREMLQHDRQLKAIAQRLEKKIKSELSEMLHKDREAYSAFFKNFGLQLKFGVYDKYGMHKDLLSDLLIYHSSTEEKMVTLSEYVSRMKEDQKFIYYACGESIEKIDHMPQTELLKDKGFEILYMTDDIDEFAVQMLREYEGKQFRSVSSEDLEIEESEEEKEQAQKQEEESRELLDFMKETLGDRVSEVRLSRRLKTHPVCLTTRGGISIEMEKVLNAMPADEKVRAERVLEINADHEIAETLKRVFEEDREAVRKYTEILYGQALLIEGLSLEDPIAYTDAVCSLMTGK